MDINKNNDNLNGSEPETSIEEDAMKQAQSVPNEFEAQMGRILEVFGVSRDIDLARAFGKAQTTISSVRVRKTIPAKWLKELNSQFGISINWILKGIGPIRLPESKSSLGTHLAADYAEGDIRKNAAVAQRPPGQKAAPPTPQDQGEVMLKDRSLDLNQEPSPTIESRGFKMSEMLSMTARVLESGTTYAVALAYNIQHFDRAITAESRIDKLQQSIQSQGQTISNQAGIIHELQDECISVRKEVEELKSQLARLLATGGDDPGQKVA